MLDNIFVDARLPTCASDLKSRTLIYEWRVYQGIHFQKNLKTESPDLRYFKLSPYTSKQLAQNMASQPSSEMVTSSIE